MRIDIRPERPGDHPDVFAVNAAAFDTAAEAELIEAVRSDAEPLISLVAIASGRVVGHILFSPVTVEAEGVEQRLAMGLGPMAVAPEHQRSGVGSRLVRAGLEACRAIGEDVIFVLGHADYYPRFGFESARPRGLWYRDEAFDPHFFVAGLRPGALDGWSGQIHYHPEFEKF